MKNSYARPRSSRERREQRARRRGLRCGRSASARCRERGIKAQVRPPGVASASAPRSGTRALSATATERGRSRNDRKVESRRVVRRLARRWSSSKRLLTWASVPARPSARRATSGPKVSDIHHHHHHHHHQYPSRSREFFDAALYSPHSPSDFAMSVTLLLVVPVNRTRSKYEGVLRRARLVCNVAGCAYSTHDLGLEYVRSCRISWVERKMNSAVQFCLLGDTEKFPKKSIVELANQWRGRSFREMKLIWKFSTDLANYRRTCKQISYRVLYEARVFDARLKSRRLWSSEFESRGFRD